VRYAGHIIRVWKFVAISWRSSGKSINCKPVLAKIRNVYFLIRNISMEERRDEHPGAQTRGNSSLLGLRSQ
jgi:hypothetical protein